MVRYASRYIPRESAAIPHPKGESHGMVYTYTTDKGSPAAVAYWGKQNKATWHHSWMGDKSIQRRQEKIDAFLVSIDQHAQMMAERKAERSNPHNIPVGTIIYNSWGYDQTNIDWYEVVKTTAKFVYLRELKSQTEETGFMCGVTRPIRGQYRNGEILQKSADRNGYVNFPHGCGYVWDGKDQRASWYA